MTDNTKDLKAHLAEVPIFTGLSSRQLARLADASRTTTHQSGHEMRQGG